MSEKSSVQTEVTGPKRAHDIMTTDVVSVPPDLPVRKIAELLHDKRISAVPVVDSDGVPIGMVSEGDLIARDERERLSRGDWWLAVLSGRRSLDDKSEGKSPPGDRTARDIMSAPLVTVTEDTKAGEIARLLAIHHIKRVPGCPRRPSRRYCQPRRPSAPHGYRCRLRVRTAAQDDAP